MAAALHVANKPDRFVTAASQQCTSQVLSCLTCVCTAPPSPPWRSRAFSHGTPTPVPTTPPAAAYSYATILLPSLLLHKRYFKGEIRFGDISQASFAMHT